MRLVNMTCPNCGAQLQIDADRNQVYCEHCGTKLLMQDEVQRFRYENAEDAGYQFEKGRQRAIAEAEARRMHNTCMQNPENVQPRSYSPQPQRKRRTWLWVLGWLFIFPLPLTILLRRKPNMNPVLKYAIIVIAWVIYFSWVRQS